MVRAPASTAPWTTLSPTPPRAVDDDAAARLDLRGVADGANACHDAAGEQRRGVERHVVRDRDDLRRVDGDALREGAGAHALVDRPAVERCQGRALRQREVREPLAQRRLAAHALRAAPARPDERHDHVIALCDTTDALAHLLDDARRLVPVHGRQVAAPGALHEGDVAVADRAGRQADRHLARGGPAQLDVLDPQRLAERMAHRGLHACERTPELG
jgi:hypothetical protein